MKKRNPGRRLLAALLAFAMCLALMPEAFAESATAAAMRLIKTEGTVSVENSSGRSVSIREKMRLYSGYSISTEESSYAWINLDSTKLVKEDAASEISIRKSGKQLELLLESGNLFFNVTEPLKDDESLNIRTSTMSVGIRGTCGWVKVTDEWISQLFVLEGSVEASVTDPVTGETKTETVNAGESVSCVVYSQDRSGDKCDILREAFTEDDISGFVLVDVVGDGPLCGEIYEASGLDLRGWPGDPADRLEQDEQAVHEKLQEIQEAIGKQEQNISSTPVWSDPQAGEEPSGGGSSTGNSSPAPGGVDSGPAVPSAQSVLMMPVTDDTADSLLRSGSVSIEANPQLDAAGNTLAVDSGLHVPAGISLGLQPGIDVEVLGGQTLRVDGTMTVGGNLSNGGTVNVTSPNTLRVQGSLVNRRNMSVSATGRVVVDGTFVQAGSLSPVEGAVIQAKRFDMAVPVTGWRVSGGADSQGYYTLVYSPGPETFTITLDYNGVPVSSGAASVETDENGRATLPEPSYGNTAGSLTFTGWFTEKNGGTEAGDTYTSSQTVYARWSGWGLAADGTLIVADDASMAGKPWESAPGFQKTNIKSVIILPGVTEIGDSAFQGYTGLTKATIPETAASIAADAFDGCGNLTDIDYGGTKAQWGQIGCTVPGGADIHCSDGNIARYTITFDLNGGPAGAKTPDDVKTDAATGKAALPTDVYTPQATGGTLAVAGWSTGKDGTGPVTNDTVFTENTILYAQWSGWELRADGTLILAGDAASTDNDNPWESAAGFQKTDVKSAIILPGASRIGNDKFDGYSDMATVTIPDSVTSIGDYAFNGCTSLKNLTIGTNVTSIGRNAFDGCAGLTAVTIPGSVTSIGRYAFNDCTGLETVVIGDGVTTIGSSAFRSCTKLTDVAIPDSVTSIGSYAFYNCNGLTEITIPENVTSIEAYTFYGCDNLKSMTIPDGVTTIGMYAFWYCTGLTEVEIPASMASIGSSAFYNTALEDVNYGGSIAEWEELRKSIATGNDPLLAANIHYLGEGPHTITLDPGDGSEPTTATTQADGTLASLPMMARGNVSYTSGDTTVEGVCTFDGWHTTEKGKSGTTVTTETVFSEDTTIYAYWTIEMTVSGPGAMANYASSTSDTAGASRPWYKDRYGISKVTIASDVTAIGILAFSQCQFLETVDISSGVTYISPRAFYACSMKNVVIPDTVTSIGASAFNSSRLESVTIGNGVDTIGSNAFGGCRSLTDVTIGTGVVIINVGAFYNCTSLESIRIPARVTTIGASVFEQCTGLKHIYYDGTQAQWAKANPENRAKVPDGCTVHCSDGNTVIGVHTITFDLNGVTTVTPPEDVKTDAAGKAALSTDVYTPQATGGTLKVTGWSTGEDGTGPVTNDTVFTESATVYAQWSGWDYTEDGTLILAGDAASATGNPWQDTSVRGERATSAVILPGATEIHSARFSNYSSLASVTIPDSVTIIGDSVFTGCTSLTEITIPDSVTSIETSAFNGCSGLAEITIPESVTSIGVSAFQSCTSLTKVEIPNKVTSISNGAFQGCTKLASVTIPDSVTNIEAYAFQSCIGLTKVEIPENVDSIGNYAFKGCSKLESVTIPDSVTSIGTGVFQNCTELQSATIGSSVTSISNYAFESCSKLKSVTIPDSVTSIGTAAFQTCGSLTEINIPASVESIGLQAFFQCAVLKHIYYGGTREQWDAANPGDRAKVPDGCTVHCTGDVYTITFDPNGGTVDPETADTAADGKLSELPCACQNRAWECTCNVYRMVQRGW